VNRLSIVIILGGVLAVSARWTGRAQQPPAAAPPRITGTSVSMDAKDLTILRRSFEAGARTFWHSHAHGQLLMVEKGKMRIQKRGQPMKELGVSASEYTAPDIVHWHGATPDQPLVQIAAGFGGMTKWLEEVTSDEYSGKKK
jgi:quercetin dioxygenase-like cupin family protein